MTDRRLLAVAFLLTASVLLAILNALARKRGYRMVPA